MAGEGSQEKDGWRRIMMINLTHASLGGEQPLELCGPGGEVGGQAGARAQRHHLRLHPLEHLPYCQAR